MINQRQILITKTLDTDNRVCSLTIDGWQDFAVEELDEVKDILERLENCAIFQRQNLMKQLNEVVVTQQR